MEDHWALEEAAPPACCPSFHSIYSGRDKGWGGSGVRMHSKGKEQPVFFFPSPVPSLGASEWKVCFEWQKATHLGTGGKEVTDYGDSLPKS